MPISLLLGSTPPPPPHPSTRGRCWTSRLACKDVFCSTDDDTFFFTWIMLFRHLGRWTKQRVGASQKMKSSERFAVVVVVFFFSFLCFFAFKMAAPIFLFPLRKRLLPRGCTETSVFLPPELNFICQNVLCVPPRSSIREALSPDKVDSLHE